MPADDSPLVDASDIIRLVGPTSFQRARAYATGGAVSQVSWDPATSSLTATVQGTTPWPYVCRVSLAPARHPFHRPVSSVCSCPLGGDCKHVAAALLEHNRVTVRGAVPSFVETDPADGWYVPTDDEAAWNAASDPKASTATVATEVDPTPMWKRAVTALAGTPSAPDGGGAARTPLALLFELREQMPRTRERWRGPAAKAASTSQSDTARVRLGVRPVMKSATGNWVRGNITWNSLAYQSNRLALDPAQQRWFAQFAALHRATRHIHTGLESDWLYLDDFHSPLLWRLLEDAAIVGIPLVGGKKNGSVSLGTVASISIDVTDGDGDLVLSTVLSIDGVPHPASSARPIGDHGIYTWEFSPAAAVVIAPTARALSAEQVGLLGQAEPLVVPASDATEFLREYYPTLAHSIEVTNSDGSVELPAIVPPVLVLTVTFTPRQSLRLAWAWEYTTSGDRDEAFEREVLARLGAVTGEPVTGAVPPPASLQGLGAAEFVHGVLPEVERVDGVRVETVGARPDYRELTDVPQLVVTTVETDQRDWFDLGVLVTVDGVTVPFGPLFKALSKGAKKLLLIDNSFLSLEQPVFDDLKHLIGEASTLNEWETGPRISRYQASLWSDFEDLADETEQAVSWRTAVGGLLAADGVGHTPLPTGLTAELRGYQTDGYEWLTFLWKHRLGGILADDMGLGKTLQALALVAHAVEQHVPSPDEPRAAPFLVVAPTSVVSNWLVEADRFTQGLTVRGLTTTQGKSGTKLAADVAGVDLVVTSYALFRLDFEAYQALGWSGLILDEAQFVKNHTAKAHQCAVELNTPFKLAITGTPMENSLNDLWSLFAIVAPGLFPSNRRFTEEYVRPIGRGEGAERLARLRRRIRPLMMRRSKELVATELPAKQEQTLRVDLSPRHRKLYDTVLQRERQKLLGLIEDLDRNRFIVFRSLTLLRMLSLDASLVDDAYSDIPSSKLDALFEQLDDVVAENHRALVFSQFTSFLRKAAARLDEQGIRYEYLDGSTLRRPEVIARFKEGDAPVFLISLKAGGFGLNLTEADYVFLLDPWWNPASEAQAVDRTHRIGQTRSVMVYRLVASGTIEEKVMALKEQKSKLFSAVMEDDAVFSSALTADDIRGLLNS